MKIALDAMGGDFAPRAAVEGAILASKEIAADTELILVGRTEAIKEILSQHSFPGGNIVIHEAPSVIEMAEHPTKALAQKPDSSISIGFELLKSGKVSAFCSAGNTGAMHVGAMFSVKPLEGVLRPALAGFVPKEDGSFGIILDIGANADCKPEVLDQFAEIGSLYAVHVLGIQNPKVGLLNLGEEEQKGTVLTQAAHQLLKNNTNINFIGNIEGRDLFNENADVIVCDGFTGNIVLKMAESIYDLLKERNFLDPFFEKFNYEAVGGSPILGVNGNVVIGHGTSSPIAVKNMLLMAQKMAQSNIYSKIGKAFGSPVPSHE